MSYRLNRTCSESHCKPRVDLKHSITPQTKGEWDEEKNETAQRWQRKANRKKVKQTLNVHQWVFCFYSFSLSDSLSTSIHLRSRHSGVFREGQNLENRLHTRHFVTRHPSPASQRQGAAHNWGTVSQKYIRWSEAAGLHAFSSHWFCIYATFVVPLKEAKERDEVTFCGFRFGPRYRIIVYMSLWLAGASVG